MKVFNTSDHTLSLNERWNAASDLLCTDVMRPIRYGKCFRYLNSLDKNANLLEVGCGEGTGLWFAQQLNFKNLTGVEVSENRLESARIRLGPKVTLKLVGTDCYLPFADNTFDIIVSAAVIEHTVAPALFLQEIARVARPGASIVISSDCWQWRILQILRIYRSVQPVDRAMFTSRLISIIRQANLRLLHYDGFPLPQQEYRFFRMILDSFVSLILKVGRKVFRRTNSRSKPSLSANECVSEMDMFLHVVAQPWSPKRRFTRFIMSIWSDENVFFCKK